MDTKLHFAIPLHHGRTANPSSGSRHLLGVNPQTMYLWAERKQIPHLRAMGRNIRFLKSELEPFRAQFKKEIGNGKTQHLVDALPGQIRLPPLGINPYRRLRARLTEF
jgi:predicted DNA-binding transcriptional regulator AlpA